jgi:hypothetical protein
MGLLSVGIGPEVLLMLVAMLIVRHEKFSYGLGGRSSDIA